MKTIKALLVSALLVLAGTVSAQSFSITFADVNVENGAGKLVASMTKDMTVAGWQMFLYLPEGVEIAQVYDEDEEEYVADITLSSTFHKAKHSCSVKKTADNAMMLICSGGTETVALKSATEGELCTIGLKVADGVTSQAVAVKNVAVSDDQGVQSNQADTTFQLIIGSTGIVNIENDAVNSGVFYNLAGQKVSNAQKGVLIQNGKKVVVK
jgi:hypothetical protein